MAISLEDVKKAVDTLKEEGVVKPSAGKVRAIIGTGGMGTIQKYLKEIRDAEAAVTDDDTEQKIEPVTVDQAMVTNHVQTIIEHVADATRSKYLQKLIDLDKKTAGLEFELSESKRNFDELAVDFEEEQAAVSELKGVETVLREKFEESKRNYEQLEQAQIDATASFEEKLVQVRLEHKNEVMTLKAANEQLLTVVDSITKRIGVVEPKTTL